MAIKYLGIAEFAEHIGVSPDTLRKYNLPPHDAEIGDRKGWLIKTIDTWNGQRPGKGWRGNPAEQWRMPTPRRARRKRQTKPAHPPE